MRNTLFIGLFLLVSTLAMSQEDHVIFSSPGGFYDQSFYLTLSCQQPDHHIRYTINGNTPTSNSPLYREPLYLDERLYSTSDIYKIQISPDELVYLPDSVRHAIVIRAAAFDNSGQCVGETKTNTYLIGALGCESNGLAVVSICADSLSLFDYDSGIFVPGVNWKPDKDRTGNYYKHGKDWERLVNMEFYEPDDNSGINQCCGLRTHGNLSRMYPSKGMKVYAREEYGKKSFEHAFFNDASDKSFKHLVLKPFPSFWPYSGAQDYFCNQLALSINLDTPNSRPILVYLNGEYWGVYFIQEKMDERYLEHHFGVDPDDCNLIGSWKGEVEQGTDKSFNKMMSWFRTTDLTKDANYKRASKYIDIDNFINYMVFETFVGNWDWPGNNMRCWQEDDKPWRWLFFDGDCTLVKTISSFNVFSNAALFFEPASWINYPDATLLFGKLLENNTFKAAFRSRAKELCNEQFRYENTLPILDSIIEALQPHIENQKHRFGYPYSLESWFEDNQSFLYGFIENRVEEYLQAIEDFPLFQKDYRLADLDKFICFPNPTNGSFSIKMNESMTQILGIYIYNVLGQLVYHETHSAAKNEIVVINADLPAGTYIIRIGSCYQRLIKF